jgi:uncharacterized protein (DUF1684 family)
MLVFIISSIQSQENYADSLSEVRKAFNEKVLSTDYILNKKERQKIETLTYFPVDTNWRIEAILEKDKGKRFKMPTSTDRTPTYRRYGWIIIETTDTNFRLAAYQNLELKGKQYKNYLFIPFKDVNAPKTTYGAGRYVEAYKQKGENNILIDFNTAYNPYCAYSYRYSCPITPEVNHLNFPINAGEKNPILRKTEEEEH